MLKNNAFSIWLQVFIEEKGIDLEDSFEVDVNGETNFFTYEVVTEAILSAPINEQAKIKNMLVEIDFKNGDVKHYLRFLGECMVKVRIDQLEV
jgi:hypothetical protein